ncbi:MAG: T9SS type A sorting domain-containing protein [Bacteroidetes bacterium]|nr:T9SS type A sorting domain-containing protein [Bacteroidota bacterium]
MKNSIAKLLVIFSFSFFMTGLLYAEFNPNGGENGEFWSQNTTKTIKWDTSYFHNTVNIYLWNMTSSTFTTIDTSIQASLGEYNWQIPVDQPTGNFFRVKIRQTDSAELEQFSETFFPIYEGSSPHSEFAEKPVHTENIYISPNPVTDKIKLSLDFDISNKSNVTIFDCLGKVWLSLALNTNLTELNCTNLPSGVFYAVVNANGKIKTKPFVVIR